MGFHTHLRLFKYTIMPFGLTNTHYFSSTNSSDLLDISCVIYLDNILVFSHPEQDHKALVTQVFEQLQAA